MAMTEFNSAKTLQALANKRRNSVDDMVSDFIATTVQPGDNTIQVGNCDLGSIFLQAGAFHHVMGSLVSVESLQGVCERRAIRTERLRGGSMPTESDGETGLDAALLGPGLGFSVLGSSWRHIANRLKVGGLLFMVGAGQGGSARLSDALMADEHWTLEELIGDEVAVFRKIAKSDTKRTQSHLSHVSDRNRKPRGIKPGFFAGVVRTLFRDPVANIHREPNRK
jgi:hypothetical protein